MNRGFTNCYFIKTRVISSAHVSRAGVRFGGGAGRDDVQHVRQGPERRHVHLGVPTVLRLHGRPVSGVYLVYNILLQL